MRGSLLQLSKRMLSSNMELAEKELFVQAPWGKVAVLTWGDAGNKPVLLLHGKLDSAAVFRPLVRLLPQHFYYVGVEFPGNGRSDALPKGLPLSVLDLVPSVKMVVDHLGVQSFSYVAHSLGAQVGKFFHIAYPDRVEAVVDVDPLPTIMTCERDRLHNWYRYFYGDYFEPKAYEKYNGAPETAPVYTREKALEVMQSMRGISEAAAEIAIERTLEPAGNGLYRFTFDRRMKRTMRPPIPAKYLEEIFTRMSVPMLCVIAQESIDGGWYDSVPFVRDESKFEHGNYRVMHVQENHDVHLNRPEVIADEVGRFLVRHAGVDTKL